MALSYNVSPNLKKLINRAELLRQKIAISPISRKNETKLQWDATVQKLVWSLSLSDNTLSKRDIEKILFFPIDKELTKEEKEIVNYKKALDYINQNWYVTTRPVLPQTILKLHEIACSPTISSSLGDLFRQSEESLDRFLNYLQTGEENAIIQAGIAQIEIVHLKPFTDGNGRAARLSSLLLLHKYGYDFRGLLVLSEFWRRDVVAFRQITKSVLRRENLTLWLEYFAHAVVSQLEKTVKTIDSMQFKSDLPESYWELNERQKQILSTLDQPAATIKNKQAQKMFKISQITASRDLAKLVSLGLVFAHGKGRSVYYTKV